MIMVLYETQNGKAFMTSQKRRGTRDETKEMYRLLMCGNRVFDGTPEFAREMYLSLGFYTGKLSMDREYTNLKKLIESK